MRHRLGVCLSLVRRDHEAAQAFSEALARDPAHAGSRYNLGVLLRRSRPAEAAMHLALLRNEDPELATLLESQLTAS